MKRKLELKEIAGNLPYGLYSQHFAQYNEPPTIQRVIGIAEDCISFGSGKDYYFENYLFEVEDNPLIKIILRPESDMYKPITHNGKEIIPIVELAKIAKPLYDWKLDADDNRAIDSNTFFSYRNFHCGFMCVSENRILDINNQYQLFDYLHELKIDYRGLIDAGLAISVYDLDVNPYK